MQTPQSRYAIVRRVTIVSVLTNTLLGLVKCVMGWFGHSQALLADGLHSFSDLFSDIVVFLATKIGSQDADHDHPYGHARVETAATVALAMMLLAVAIGIIWQAVQAFMGALPPYKPSIYVLVVAAVSVVANEALYRYTLFMAKRIKSQLLETNAWHSRSDAASSLIVIAGVIASLLGYPRLDAVAAMLVGCFIARMAWRLGWSSVQELVDTGLDEKTLLDLREAIEQVPGVCELHQLRTRSMAGSIFIDVHVLVDPKLSVSEGHFIGEHVQHRLIRTFSDVTDVTVHVDPEDDEVYHQSKCLPERAKILAELQACWSDLPGYSQSSDIILHYLEGKLSIDVILPLEYASDRAAANQLSQDYQGRTEGIQHIASVVLLFR